MTVETRETKRRRPYRHDQARERPLRHEWVPLEYGDVCVREMRLPELVQVLEIAARPKIDPRGGVDPGTSAVWQILYSCYESEARDALPVWPHNPEGIAEVADLGMETFLILMKAIQRVNGMDDKEVEAFTSFFPQRPGESS